jgi:hypothetical protein
MRYLNYYCGCLYHDHALHVSCGSWGGKENDVELR